MLQHSMIRPCAHANAHRSAGFSPRRQASRRILCILFGCVPRGRVEEDVPFALTAVLFGLIVLATHFIQGITGFGCTVLAMPFCILLTGIDTARPVLTVLALILDVYLLVVSWKHVDRRQYLRILAFVLPGLPIGMIAYNVLPQTTLMHILAIFMVVVGIQGLVTQFRPGRGTPRPWPAWLLNTLLFIGGAMQGAFTSGGPPVIIYATQKLKDKASFRATLVAIWTTLNVFIIADIVLRHKLAGEPGRLVLTSLPFLALGALLGDIAHHHISGERFIQLIYAVLLISAVFMVL
ncbi:sulfite exporter TauE/SafE family protein [Candidatus Cryosericum odellii]|uniref:Probable membrane transporter protein n=1 Tax=Candidatus Cryosericum odellii TaxID=2290917 RepID=A0A398DUV2_9BACT|nr:sulfite exporter TauE/SafE family protein [Candidatus Cryosericum odellii]